MAEALLGVALENLLKLVQSEFETFSGIKQKTEQLSSTLRLIKAVLDDAEEKQWTDRSIKVWLQELKDAVHVLDDILDECPPESLQLGRLSSFKPKNIMFRRRVGRKLNKMIRRLDRIAEDKKKFVLREGERERLTKIPEWRETSSIIAQSQVYGRDEDKKEIVEFLLGPAPDSDFPSVYAIVGLGGLGKTTLAQLVYNDQGVSNHFDLKIWICVSENFTMKRILCSIIESMKDKCDSPDLDVMEQKVRELLQSKRYLLVLDDVWKTNQEYEFGLSQDKWDKLKAVLSCGSNASILVSTRDMEVARIMRACQAHDLSRLSDDNCWSLFKQRAFADQEERADLVAIGREIVKKCGGSPLAAKALGGLMRNRSEKREWLEVKENKLWTLSDGNDILPALRLSYFHLMPTLKQCFAFCAIFPKDAEIMKEDLIHLWMANGLISSRENLDVEEVGNRIWIELYQKSFFQDVRTSDDLGNICFKMHDLVHDLAQSITEQECVCLEREEFKPIELSRNTHHVGFGCDWGTSFNKEACEKVESLRTLYQLDCAQSESIFWGWFPTNRSLRVLRTNYLKLSLLGNLTHLRYLELQQLGIKTLPDSIYNLRRLEILKLIDMDNLCLVPKHLTRLQNLRHLVISGCDLLFCMFPNIRKLSHLRTLSIYIVKKEEGHSLAELRNLNLGGKLGIEGLANVGSSSEAQEANLKDKEDLRELSLSWNIGLSSIGSDSTESQANAGQVLEGLQPPSSLKVLEISYYKGLHWPNWTGNNSILSKLVRLTLVHCDNVRQLPSLVKLPNLRKLEILSIVSVQYMDDDECYDGVEVRAFPSLEELYLRDLPNLEQLLKIETGDMFPLLSTLTVKQCRKLRLSRLPCVKSLRVLGCNNELLTSISSLSSLEDLELRDGGDMTSLPEGMMDNLNCLKDLVISSFPKLKELPYEITKLNALKSLAFGHCDELESLPEQVLRGLSSLRTLDFAKCEGLRSLPEGVRHLTSLVVLYICECPELMERCKEGTGEDWHKIEHIPEVIFNSKLSLAYRIEAHQKVILASKLFKAYLRLG